jgi:hypothetical protein
VQVSSWLYWLGLERAGLQLHLGLAAVNMGNLAAQYVRSGCKQWPAVHQLKGQLPSMLL